MKFSANEDIEAPVETVFAAITDFAVFERAALKRGAQLRRTEPQGAVGVGTGWAGTVPFRGKQRQISLTVAGHLPPSGLQLRGETGNLNLSMSVEVMALSRGRSRLHVAVEVLPRTLTARLLLQSAKIGKGGLDRRFKARVRAFADSIAGRGS
jgi:hypothetical protein